MSADPSTSEALQHARLVPYVSFPEISLLLDWSCVAPWCGGAGAAGNLAVCPAAGRLLTRRFAPPPDQANMEIPPRPNTSYPR